MKRDLQPHELIERSIIKKFRKTIWNPFTLAVRQYQLIQPGDMIAVCISGGKDSMLMAKLMQLLQRYSEVPFEVVFLVMDPGYNEINRNKIESNAALLHIPITAWLQQDRTWPPLQRRHRNHRDEYVLWLTDAGHAAQAAQHQLCRHGADSSAVLHS